MNSMVLEMPAMISSPSGVTIHQEIMQKRIKTVYDELFASLKQKYNVPDEQPVFAFLRQHSQLIPLLQEGREAVAVFFGDETPVLLRLRHDPETGMVYLLAWIQSKHAATEAVNRWLAFGDAWLLEQTEMLGDSLQFSLG